MIYCDLLLPLYFNLFFFSFFLFFLGDTHLDFGLVPTKLCLQVLVNILKLARSLTGQNRMIFGAGFDRPNKHLSLGMLTKILMGTSSLLISSQEKNEICKRRLDSIHDMTTQQLSELLPPNSDEKLPAHISRMIGAQTLEKELKNWEDLLELCSLILESATWLLWHYMKYYLQQKRGSMLVGPSAILSLDELNRLKEEVPLYLNPTLFKKMNDCEQVNGVPICILIH